MGSCILCFLLLDLLKDSIFITYVLYFFNYYSALISSCMVLSCWLGISRWQFASFQKFSWRSRVQSSETTLRLLWLNSSPNPVHSESLVPFCPMLLWLSKNDALLLEGFDMHLMTFSESESNLFCRVCLVWFQILLTCLTLHSIPYCPLTYWIQKMFYFTSNTSKRLAIFSYIFLWTEENGVFFFHIWCWKHILWAKDIKVRQSTRLHIILRYGSNAGWCFTISPT